MVAIKGMEIPKSCALCERFEGSCKYTDFGDYQTERNPSCPLVEIGTCKDCKHCCFITGTKNRVCEKHGCMQVSSNWYCADFEKRGAKNEN